MKSRIATVAGIFAMAIGLVVQVGPAQAGMVVSPDVTELGLQMRENVELGRMPSTFYTIPNWTDNKSWRLCKDVDDKLCTEATRVGAIANLAPCLPTSQLSCISEVWAIDPSGKRIDGEFVKNAGVDPRYKIDEIPSINYPRSDGVGSIWKIPGVMNSAGKDTYFAASQITGNAEKSAGASTTSANFTYGNLMSGIMPVEEISANVKLISATDASINPQGAFGVDSQQYAAGTNFCAATETGVCHAVRQFPEGYKFGMTIRLTKKESGWFHGRFALPNITIKTWKTGHEISIEAEPVKVPSLDFAVPNAQIPQKIRDMVMNGQEWGMSGNGKSRTVLDAYLGSQTAMDLVSAFAPAYQDKATKTDTFWSFKSLNFDGPTSDVSRCSLAGGDLAGLVTTNALSYSAGPPSYDKSTGSLNYKVASPHYEADGKTIASGSYDLALRSDVARCVYGFSKAPIQAEISITSQDGEKKVATTLVNERNGWLYLSAKGFTFSAPVINVKLTQEKVVEPTPTPTPTPTKAGVKSTTITCVKGKVTKKVTGASPKCPAGYKKK